MRAKIIYPASWNTHSDDEQKLLNAVDAENNKFKKYFDSCYNKIATRANGNVPDIEILEEAYVITKEKFE